MLFRKRKKIKVPKYAFDHPYKHRFTFVPKGCTYYEGYTVQVSEKVDNIKKAFYYATCELLNHCTDLKLATVAVFYGNTESPDCMDKLYMAYSSFDKINKKLRLR